MSDYNDTLLEQLEDAEGENEVLSLEVERLTRQVEMLEGSRNSDLNKFLERVAQALGVSRNKFEDPGQMSAYLAQRARSVTDELAGIKSRATNDTIDILVTPAAQRMYKGDKDGNPDPTDRYSYDEWMRRAGNLSIKEMNTDPGSVYRIKREDLVREYFVLCELVAQMHKKQAAMNANTMTVDNDALWQRADSSRLDLFKQWLKVNSLKRTKTPFENKDNNIYLTSTPSNRDSFDLVYSMLERAAAKKKQREEEGPFGKSYYADMLKRYRAMVPPGSPNKNGVTYSNQEMVKKAMEDYMLTTKEITDAELKEWMEKLG